MRHDDASYTYVMFNIVLYCVSYECLRMDVQNQNQNSLLVKRQNDNTSPGDWPRKISP